MSTVRGKDYEYDGTDARVSSCSTKAPRFTPFGRAERFSVPVTTHLGVETTPFP